MRPLALRDTRRSIMERVLLELRKSDEYQSDPAVRACHQEVTEMMNQLDNPIKRKNRLDNKNLELSRTMYAPNAEKVSFGGTSQRSPVRGAITVTNAANQNTIKLKRK